MDYPVWYVPFLTAPMLIPLVAIPHVIVAQFAVGGGFLLADMVQRARREGHTDVLSYLRDLTRFFVLLTIVFGAVTGVGIWWTIGLTAPAATSALIHVFVFGWATEWVAFIVEIVAAFVFYYMWDRLTPREHAIVGWIYAGAAWVSLVLITGITAFMLTSGRWTPEKGFFVAFLNPSFGPQTLIRTGGSLAMAALFVGLHISLRPAGAWKDWVVQRISIWALGGMIFIFIGSLWYLGEMPEHAQLNMIRAPALILMATLNFAVTLIVITALAIGIASGSRWITPPSAALLFLAGVVAISTGEFIREGARKPYQIEYYILSPGVRVTDLKTLQREGFITHTPWLRFYLKRTVSAGLLEELDALSSEQKARVGEGIYRYHCASCHALWGYNGIVPLVRPWTPTLIREAIRHLHMTNPAMPPWMGNEVEREALATYLIQLSQRVKSL